MTMSRLSRAHVPSQATAPELGRVGEGVASPHPAGVVPPGAAPATDSGNGEAWNDTVSTDASPGSEAREVALVVGRMAFSLGGLLVPLVLLASAS